MNGFKDYLLDLGKSENTATAYLRDAKLFLAWCRDSFGDEPKLLHRANVLEYISYMRNVRGYHPKTVNHHLSSLRSLKVRDSDSPYLFVSRQSRKRNPSRINQIFNQYSDVITPKTLRHYFCEQRAKRTCLHVHLVTAARGEFFEFACSKKFTENSR